MWQAHPTSPASDSNLQHIENDTVQHPAIDVNPESDSIPLIQREPSSVPVMAKTILTVSEGRGSQKHHGKHPSTLFECDCGEVISGSNIEQDESLDSSIVYVHHERAMIGEGVLWKRVGAEGTSWRGELDSFAQMVSEISRTPDAACRGVVLV